MLCVLAALMDATPEMASWTDGDPRLHPEATCMFAETLAALPARGVEDVNGGIEYGVAGYRDRGRGRAAALE